MRLRTIGLEDRVALSPPMHLVARRTLDGILLLDRRIREDFRIHREAGVDQLSRSRTLYIYTMHDIPGRTVMFEVDCK
jgi:hypothetical protein